MTRPTRTEKRERLYLLDGMALAYRAYFSFISRPLINSKGANTGAIYGFVVTLMKVLDEERPEHIAVAFDTREPTFRHKLYAPYKATREKMPEDMAGQIQTLKEVIGAFNVPTLELPGYEADDIMGTLARRAERAGIETFLVTADKDFMQLISPLIRMYKPGKRGDEWEVVDERGVKEKFGVTPENVIDVLALAGDSSDNVPGVRGVGEKTAIPLVQEYGALESILAHLDTIPQKGLRQKLSDHREEALLSKRLVTIDTDVPLDVDIHHLVARPRDTAKLARLFAELEFRSLLGKMKTAAQPEAPASEIPPNAPAVADITTEPHRYHVVRTKAEFRSLLERLGTSKAFVFDTETTSTDPLAAELVGISFAVAPGEAWYVPTGLPGCMTVKEVLAPLSRVFGDPAIAKTGQNIKYDMLVLASHGIETHGVAFDTMIASYILRPDGAHSMDALAAEHLGYKTVTFDELTGTGKDRKDIRDLPLEAVADYSAEDADITCRLREVLREKLARENLLPLCERIEFPLVEVLADMEFTGIAVDRDYLSQLSKEFERTLDLLTREIHASAGEPFNINSTQQLAKVLFDTLSLAPQRKTKTGRSTDVGVLEALRHAHPIVEKLLEYRQVQKLRSTYVDALPALINARTGRIHTSFNQAVASTGRLSSSNPNLQNIPIRTELGKGLRKAFIPGASGLLLISADYSQIELRVMAHISGDEGLGEAFRSGEDIHATTAARVFQVDARAVTQDMRRKAKEVNYGIMYGIGAYGLASRLDISQAEARDIIARYFERFPKVREWIAETLSKARRDGYVSTLLGRRRYLPDLTSRNGNIRSNAERQAINMPIQGTAADMIKLAMISIHDHLRSKRIEASMLLQVHDELVFEVSERHERQAKEMIRADMMNALPLSVPIDVDIGAGRNWLEAH